MIRIELPWPAKPLHPNARPHRMEKAYATKTARAEAAIVAKRKVAGLVADRLKVTAIFHPPSNRGDTDNMQAACKAYLDGIADAAGIDDKHFDLQKPVRGWPVKGGLVVFAIEVSS